MELGGTIFIPLHTQTTYSRSYKLYEWADWLKGHPNIWSCYYYNTQNILAHFPIPSFQIKKNLITCLQNSIAFEVMIQMNLSFA